MPVRCWIKRDALKFLTEEASRWRFRETGGALLGWRENREYVVEVVLGPGPRAKHGFFHFEPDAAWQAERGREIYLSSGRTIAYQGDWHSHPYRSPHPSKQDLRTASDIADDPGFRAPEPVYAIVGLRHKYLLKDTAWDLKVYVFVDGDLMLTQLAEY